MRELIYPLNQAYKIYLPDEWLGEEPEARRGDFREFLRRRLAGQETFIRELESTDD